LVVVSRWVICLLTLTTVGCHQSTTAPTPTQPTAALLISPATPFVPLGQSVSFTALTPAALDQRLVPTSAVWSVGDQSVASVSPGGTIMGRATGRTFLRADTPNGTVTQSIIVRGEPPTVWTGTYRVTGCTGDPIGCSMASKGFITPRQFRLEFYTDGDVVIGRFAVEQPAGPSGVVEGVNNSGMFRFAQSGLMTAPIEGATMFQFCCSHLTDITIATAQPMGAFTRADGDGRGFVGTTFSNVIETVAR
jgi:hypothetical protein